MFASRVKNMKATASIIALSALLIGLFPTPTASIGYSLPVCSATVHDKYKVTGPDGVQYATWHPQIDHRNNCHFDHEHGSSPGLIGRVSGNYSVGGIQPVYGYSAKGDPEGHPGFKTIVFRQSGYSWMVTVHFGTANPPNAACHQFHTFDLVIVDDAGVIKADIHLMGDFGKATSQNDVPLTPTACPNQANEIGGSTGARLLPVETENEVAYEPWRTDSREYTLLGLRTGGLTINTNDPQKMCNAIVCDIGVQMFTQPNEPARGANRFLTFANGGANGAFRISGAVSGTFYTDPTGRETRVATDPDALQQYIAPGFSVTVPNLSPNHFRSATSEGMFWVGPDTTAPDQLQMKLNRLVTGPN